MLGKLLFSKLFTKQIPAHYEAGIERPILSLYPAINSRCSAQYKNHPCRECVKHCPMDAIDLLNQQIDNERCIKCGECVVVCMHKAIEGIDPPQRHISSRSLTLLKNEYITDLELEQWLENGSIDNIIIDKTDTKNKHLLERLNQQRHAQGKSVITYKTSEIDTSRRHLFSSLRVKTQDEKDKSQLVGNVIKSVAIDLNENACNACFACVRLCPTGAISQDQNNWIIIPELCNECGACQNQCLKKAIQIKPSEQQNKQTIQLIKQTCVECKQSFYSHKPQTSCFVCSGRPNYHMKG